MIWWYEEMDASSVGMSGMEASSLGVNWRKLDLVVWSGGSLIWWWEVVEA